MADCYLRNSDDVHENDHGLGDDDDVEMTSVKSFVDLNRLFVIIAHLMLSMQFVFVVPCHAYQHFVQTPLMSMNAPNFSMQHGLSLNQVVRRYCAMV